MPFRRQVEHEHVNASETVNTVAPGGLGQTAATQVIVSPSMTTSPYSTRPRSTCFVGSVPLTTVAAAAEGRGHIEDDCRESYADPLKAGTPSEP